MNIVGGLLVVIHMLGWAIVLGGALVNLRTGKVPSGALHGALTALLTGLILTVLLASGVLGWGEPEWPKIILKLVITLVVCGMVWWGERKEVAGTAYVGAIAGLTAVNVAIAVLWR